MVLWFANNVNVNFNTKDKGRKGINVYCTTAFRHKIWMKLSVNSIFWSKLSSECVLLYIRKHRFVLHALEQNIHSKSDLFYFTKRKYIPEIWEAHIWWHKWHSCHKVSVFSIIWDLKAVLRLQILTELQSKEGIASVISFSLSLWRHFFANILQSRDYWSQNNKAISLNLPRWQAIYYKVHISF